MFDDRPAAKERAFGLAALAAIGLGGALAVDLLVTGGFDFGPGRTPQDRQQAPAHVRMADAARYLRDAFRPLDARDPLPVDASEAVTNAELAGADDGTPSPERFAETSGEDLYDQIAALYAESEILVEDGAPYANAPPLDAENATPRYEEGYDEPAHDDEYAREDEAANVYESESPW